MQGTKGHPFLISPMAEFIPSLANMRGGRGLVARVLDSGLLGRGFDPQPGSLLKLRQFYLPKFALVYLTQLQMNTNIDGKVPAMD